jgi:succinoglycan biosynthesis transport protein ExoP
MPDPFDAYQYLAHLRARWRILVMVAGVAMAVSLVISLLLPKKYTARTTLIIEPPAGSDPRASTAVSPIYLESLKTYEHFASSDQLFAQTVERFHLRQGRLMASLEGLKRSVLDVEIPRNTKILEISVTLPDPQKAHDVAVYIAEEAIKINRRANRGADEDLIQDAQNSLARASQRLAEAEAARDRFSKRSPTVEGLRADVEQLRAMREEVDRLALSAELTVAERGRGGAEPADKSKALSAGSRAERLRREAADLDRRIATKQQVLADRSTQSERLENEYQDAWAIHDEIEKRVREIEASVGFRGERLNLVDPGITPERPSFPNVPLNVVAAAALGLIASLFYLTVEYSLESREAEDLRKNLRLASKL